MLYNKEQIMEFLPHRDPFLWVDEIIEIDPGKSIVGRKYFSPDLPMYKGHFPSMPITPGVITIECMAQTAGIAMALLKEPGDQRIGLFTSIDNARFIKKVLPGSWLTIKAKIVDPTSRFIKAECEAYVEDELCAKATVSFAYV